jgi:hypothetical protein
MGIAMVAFAGTAFFAPSAGASVESKQLAALTSTIAVPGLAIVYILWRILQVIENT